MNRKSKSILALTLVVLALALLITIGIFYLLGREPNSATTFGGIFLSIFLIHIARRLANSKA